MTHPSIETLVPHRRPMLLLDSVTAWADRTITCTASVGPDHPFLEDGEVDIMICVELVAQAVAAYVGYLDYQKGQPAKVGFLISCREAVFDAPALHVGDELEITTNHIWGSVTLGSFGGQVSRNGVRIATVEIGVFGGQLGSAGETP
jgi:predicted hotdog family 3-hydroxylacyl-ACP dehydratase